jgi:hypothetical protein
MRGESLMTVKQISVFLENKPGQLVNLVEVLRNNDIDMRALSLAEAANFGVLRIIVSDPDKTQRVLKEAGNISSVTPVLAVAVPDKPGGLYEILDALRDGDINVEYTYAFIGRKNQCAYMVFRVSDDKIPEATELLEARGIKIVPQGKLYTL